jgi:hypothetical protein
VSDQLLDTDLREMLELCEKAEPGPWKQRAPLTVFSWTDRRLQIPNTAHDAAFIAAFDPTTCAALVREVLRLRETQETYDQFVVDGHIVDEERLAELKDLGHDQS